MAFLGKRRNFSTAIPLIKIFFFSLAFLCTEMAKPLQTDTETDKETQFELVDLTPPGVTVKMKNGIFHFFFSLYISLYIFPKDILRKSASQLFPIWEKLFLLLRVSSMFLHIVLQIVLGHCFAKCFCTPFCCSCTFTCYWHIYQFVKYSCFYQKIARCSYETFVLANAIPQPVRI